MALNIEFQPITRPRNYAPQRTFVTKWDVEIENTRAKKIARSRERFTKYFDDQFDLHSDSLPIPEQDFWDDYSFASFDVPRKRLIEFDDFDFDESVAKRPRI